MKGSYWDRTLQTRLSRRGALVATGAAGAGAALLAACGGGGEGGEPPSAGSLLAPVVDDTKGVKRGGTLKSRSTLEHVTLDPMVGGGHVGFLAMAYSNLFRIKDGYKQPTDGEIEGDLVESWEFSGDRLQLTLKLHPGAHFAPLAPVNGRAVDAQDIAFSWNRFAKDGRGRLELANSANPSAPVLSLTATDNRTVVLKFKEPNSTLISLLGLNIAGSYWIMPRESDGGFDIRRQMIGSGPFYISRFEPSVSYEFKRNPEFKQDKRNLPYLDGISMPIVSETATALSQFRAGQIWTSVAPASQILTLKGDVPELSMFDSGLTHAGIRTFFGHLPTSPFKDERLRQAWSYTYNRELFLETIFDLGTYESKGIPVQTSWDHALWGDTWAGWYLDPKSKDFGPNAKYLTQNLAEAKKLVSAAGFPNGIEVPFVHTEGYRGSWQDQFQILHGFASSSEAFKVQLVESSYAAGEFQRKYRDARGQFEGVSARTDSAPDDPTLNLLGHYNSQGAQFQGNDSTLEDLTGKMLREFDTKKRQQLGHEVQRYDAKMSFFPLMGSASAFQIWWPVVRNLFVWQGGSNRSNATYFIDESKPPVRRA